MSEATELAIELRGRADQALILAEHYKAMAEGEIDSEAITADEVTLAFDADVAFDILLEDLVPALDRSRMVRGRYLAGTANGMKNLTVKAFLVCVVAGLTSMLADLHEDLAEHDREDTAPDAIGVTANSLAAIFGGLLDVVLYASQGRTDEVALAEVVGAANLLGQAVGRCYLNRPQP